MRELLCNGQLWARAVLRQHRSYKVGQREHFPETVSRETMEITVVIQYILTATQSFGSQDYCEKSRMTLLGLAGVLSYENEQA